MKFCPNCEVRLKKTDTGLRCTKCDYTEGGATTTKQVKEGEEVSEFNVLEESDGLLGQPVLEIEEPDKEGGITIIFKDNRFMFIKAIDGKIDTVSIPE